MKKARSTTRKILALLTVAALTAASAGSALALDNFFVGPRAMGMAGANVASTSDTTAQYYNPAAFGFFGCRDDKGGQLACDNNNLGRKDWGIDINAAGGYRLHNEFGAFLDDLADIDQNNLSDLGVQSESDLADLVRLVSNLNGLDNPDNAITADANVGLAIRSGRFAIGVRAFAQANGQLIELDDQNLGLNGVGDLNSQIEGINAPGFDDSTAFFSDAQVAQLQSAGLSLDAIKRLDFAARQEGLAPADAEMVDLLANLADQSINDTGGPLEENTTTVALRGFAVAEVPVSYGYAINDNWSIGGNLKLMRGRVYGTEVVVFDNDSGDILNDADEDFEESTNVGIDLGVMGRYKMVNLGLVARNINAPKFDGFSKEKTLSTGAPRTIQVDSVTIDPQVTAGVAFIPFETLTLEADYDLTKNETTFPGYETQNLSFGLEWDAFRALALRAGAYKNLAEKDIEWVYTAGLGVNLWGVRLDVGGAFAGAKETFDGEEIPKEERLAAQLSIDF